MTLRRSIHRRHLLRGAAGAAIALPLLDAMQPRRARAQSGAALVHRRFAAFFHVHGQIRENWLPQWSEAGGLVLSPILQPLEPYKKWLTVLDGVQMTSTGMKAFLDKTKEGLANPGDNHQRGIGQLLTGIELTPGTARTHDGVSAPPGWAGGISVDQRIAAHVAATMPTRFRSLELGVQVYGRDVLARISYLGANQPLPPENDPQAAFNRLFAGAGVDPAALAKLQAKRRSVLDGVKSDLTALLPRASRADRAALEAHLSALRELERQVAALGQIPAACKPPAGPFPTGSAASSNAMFPAVGKAQMDLLATALICDLTRVASLQWSFPGQGPTYPWLGIGYNHHPLSHNQVNSGTTTQIPNYRQLLTTIDKWYAEQYAYLLKRLTDAREGAGTVLDNSLVFWGSEMSDGAAHNFTNMPFVLAGSCGGHLRTGRLAKFTPPRNHNDLLLTFLEAMGLKDTTFGNPVYCTGPLRELRA